jgi:NAD(P)-dependent dehydrogenase (short-subunit alcohol dehydrogenase family)
VTYNAGINQRIDFRQLEAATFEDFWRLNTLGGFLIGREAARRFVPLGRGSIFFTGATGSLRRDLLAAASPASLRLDAGAGCAPVQGELLMKLVGPWLAALTERAMKFEAFAATMPHP